MKINRRIVWIVLLYIIVIVISIFDTNVFLTVISIMFLLIYHLYTFGNVSRKLNVEKDKSVSKLKYKLKKSIKESEEVYTHFLSLSKTLGSGVLMVDEDGIINFANKDVFNYFNLDMNNLSYVEIKRVKPLYNFVNKAYLDEKPNRDQIFYDDCYYDLKSTPIFENDIFRGCLVVIHDITLLRTAENFQKRFTADVSHELKTPLSSIKGVSELLERDKNMNLEDREEFIGIIRKEASRMETILSDLLVISKMDRIDYELKLSKTDISSVIKDSVKLLERMAISKNIDISVDVESLIMNFDKVKLEHVFINLIKNAINYTDQGDIIVTGKIMNNYYEIVFTDTGIGIPEEEMENIFKRFYRIDGARSRDSGGSGLGLSIVKNVVKKHGGEIEVISEINKGTKFVISLPI